MDIIKTVAELKVRLDECRKGDKSVGFIPTMGALHKGHGDLVIYSVKENDITVVSIFVNPTQFNNSDDLKLYPRTPERDYNLLEGLGVDIVFTPSVSEIYPVPDNRVFDFGGLDKVMEGEYRAGHFNGVAQVVSKLFNIILPDKAYFGEKDFQQLSIVKQLVKQLNMTVEIIGIPIVREQSGLAMSSRNQRLTEEEKITASAIYRVLKESVSMITDYSPKITSSHVIEALNSIPGLRVEYFSIVDSDSLATISTWDSAKSIVGCIAVYCGEVRLIDNIRYK
ncbi:MAG: pantoate--beta-alanine ligase [Bacteroidales bacterium]|nr:pantoate--beta-alanine ligase [Bacteroidales bacterium]